MHRSILPLIGLFVVYSAAPAAAQERDDDGEWWGWAVPRVLAGEDVRTTRGRNVRIGPEDDEPGIPAFCRTGAGHPVFGPRWCVEKGFGLGGGWQRVHFDGVVFKGPAHRRDDETLDESDLLEVLGDVMLDDLRRGAPAGRRGERRAGSIAGRWLEPETRGARVLQLRIGARPLAELTDLDADGKVDVVLWSEDTPLPSDGGAIRPGRGAPRPGALPRRGS